MIILASQKKSFKALILKGFQPEVFPLTAEVSPVSCWERRSRATHGTSCRRTDRPSHSATPLCVFVFVILPAISLSPSLSLSFFKQHILTRLPPRAVLRRCVVFTERWLCQHRSKSPWLSRPCSSRSSSCPGCSASGWVPRGRRTDSTPATDEKVRRRSRWYADGERNRGHDRFLNALVAWLECCKFPTGKRTRCTATWKSGSL